MRLTTETGSPLTGSHVNLVGERPSPLALSSAGILLIDDIVRGLNNVNEPGKLKHLDEARRIDIRDTFSAALVNTYTVARLEAQTRFNHPSPLTEREASFIYNHHMRMGRDADYRFQAGQITRALNYLRDSFDG